MHTAQSAWRFWETEGSPLPSFFFVEKLAAGLLSMVSGIPGGIFAPSPAVGAGLGSTLGLIFGSSTGIVIVTISRIGHWDGAHCAKMETARHHPSLGAGPSGSARAVALPWTSACVTKVVGA
ncbi:chloride channel protein [Mesorhizobium sp. ORM6]